MIIRIFLVALLTAGFLTMSCGSSEKKSSDVAFSDLDEPGMDSSSKVGMYSKRALTNYRTQAEQLADRLSRLGAPTQLEKQIEVLAIKRMLGRKVEAKEGLHALLEKNPNNALIIANLANVYIDLGNLEMARFILLRALQKHKSDAGLHNNMGLLLFRQNKIADAIVAWRTAMKYSPSNIDSRLNLASVAMDYRQFGTSEKLCSDVLKLIPEDPDAILCRCTSLAGLGKIDEADECYAEGEKTFGRWDMIVWNRAFMLHRKGKLEEAKVRIEKVLAPTRSSLSPDAPIFSYLAQLERDIRIKNAPPPPPPPPAPKDAGTGANAPTPNAQNSKRSPQAEQVEGEPQPEVNAEGGSEE